MIDERARAGLVAIVREYRAADRRHREVTRRLERADRSVARDPFRDAHIVARAVARSEHMTAAADLAALRDALKLAQRAGR